MPIFLLGFQSFSVFLPLCLWLTAKKSLKERFHNFPLGTANFFCGVSVIVILFLNVPGFLKISAVVWKLLLFTVGKVYWKRQKVSMLWLTLASLAGLVVFVLTETVFIKTPICLFMGFLSGVILALGVFTSYVGYHLLQTRQVRRDSLLMSIQGLMGGLGLRLLGDIYVFSTRKELYLTNSFFQEGSRFQWDTILILSMMMGGIVFPIILLWIIKDVAKNHFDKMALKTIYVVFILIFLADLSNRLYFIRNGVLF